MNTQPLRFGDFIWPNNPERYSSRFLRSVITHKIAGGGFSASDGGEAGRVYTMSGCFFGPGAYETGRSLEAVFREGGARTLLHPHWPPCLALMSELTLAQEPLEDYVSYTVSFAEVGQSPSTVITARQEPSAGETPAGPDNSGAEAYKSQYIVHVVIKGDTLWGISIKYNVSLDSIIALNPQIKNPNLIYAGDRVRVRRL